MDRTKQIEKYRGRKCFACGKWGASGLYQVDSVLRTVAGELRLSMREPQAVDLHDKCRIRLKRLVNYHTAKHAP